MKKKIFTILFVLLLGFSLAGCSSAGANTSKEMRDILTDAGYVLEERDADSMAYYQQSVLLDTYGITATVKELYVGYINSTERWIELVVLADGDQAAVYAQAIYAEGATGKLVIVDGPVILFTYSTDTINLFPVEKG